MRWEEVHKAAMTFKSSEKTLEKLGEHFTGFHFTIQDWLFPVFVLRISGAPPFVEKNGDSTLEKPTKSVPSWELDQEKEIGQKRKAQENERESQKANHGAS